MGKRIKRKDRRPITEGEHLKFLESIDDSGAIGFDDPYPLRFRKRRNRPFAFARRVPGSTHGPPPSTIEGSRRSFSNLRHKLLIVRKEKRLTRSEVSQRFCEQIICFRKPSWLARYFTKRTWKSGWVKFYRRPSDKIARGVYRYALRSPRSFMTVEPFNMKTFRIRSERFPLTVPIWNSPDFSKIPGSPGYLLLPPMRKDEIYKRVFDKNIISLRS